MPYSEPMTYKAVLFDLDGTLLNTLEDLADSVNRALGRVGLPQHPWEDYKTFVGGGAEVMVRRAAPAAQKDEALAGRLVALVREEYARRWAEKTRPYEGVPELLDELARRGVSMAIFSNKPHDFTTLCVAELLPHWRFDLVLGADENTPLKPDPAGALRVARQVGVEPQAFLYLGDSGVDMTTAGAAGMCGVGALWGFRTAEELLEKGAQKLINHPSELLNLLQQD